MRASTDRKAVFLERGLCQRQVRRQNQALRTQLKRET